MTKLENSIKLLMIIHKLYKSTQITHTPIITKASASTEKETMTKPSNNSPWPFK